MSNEQTTAQQELRCQDCGAPVSAEHLALAKETDQAPYCPDCWGENLVMASGAALADLKQWEAFIQERRMHYNGGYGDEPTVICDDCGIRIEEADAAYSLYNGRPICGRCAALQHAER
jgi:formylmethanofuran dehydrogenase subunit E